MTELPKPAVDAGFKALNLVHKTVLKVTGGRWPRDLFGMPGVELHTIGRKSGEPRSTMLTSPIHDENRVVLVASKGGDDRDPQWYLNLTANPDVEITIDGETRKMRARTASPEEKAELWPAIRHLQGLCGLPGEDRSGHPRRDLRAPTRLSPDAGWPIRHPGRGRLIASGQVRVRCGQCQWSQPARQSNPRGPI